MTSSPGGIFILLWRGDFMRFSFCKNSVFSILFLVSFLSGTICGVLLFRAVYVLHPVWITEYGRTLVECASILGFSNMFFVLMPFFLLLLLGMFSLGYRLIPIFVACRGCLLSYFLSCCFVSGIGGGVILRRNLVLLPLLYLISLHIWVYRPFDRYIL